MSQSNGKPTTCIQPKVDRNLPKSSNGNNEHPANPSTKTDGGAEKPKNREMPRFKNWSQYINYIKSHDIYLTVEEGALRVKTLTDTFHDWINIKLPELSMDRHQFKFFVNDRSGMKKIKVRSRQIAECDRMRLSKRSRAELIIKEGEREVAWLERERKWFDLFRRCLNPEVEVWHLKSTPIRSLKMLPSLIGIIFWLTIFIGLLLAELNTSTNLLMSAEMGFAENWFSCLLAIFVVVLFPLVTLKFLDATLGEQGKKFFDKILTTVSVPLSAIIIYLFSYTIGGAHEESSLLVDTSAEGYSFTVLYMASMFGLALAVAMAGKSLKKAISHFFDFEPVSNPRCDSVKKRIGIIGNAIAAIKYDINEMQRIIINLDNEAEEFAIKNCIELRQIKRRKAQSEESFLDNI